MTIKFWSFSSAQNFDKCPKILEHRYVLKTPKDPRDNIAANRGTEIHKEIELFISSVVGGSYTTGTHKHSEPFDGPKPTPIDPPNFSYEGLVGEFAELCKVHPFTQEEMLYFDKDWNLVPKFEDAWLLMAMDLFIRVSDTECIIVDWKSGKKEGNEVKHMHQGQLYALGAWKKFPELEKFKVVFVYIDQNTKTESTWKRGHLERAYKIWDTKGKEITNTLIFSAKPNKTNCKYCDYKQSCDYVIKEGD